MIPVAVAFVLTACSNPSADNKSQASAVQNTPSATSPRNVIRKHISIPRDFSYLTNMGCVDIIYTQGNYSIDVEGDSALLEYLQTNFDSNLLTVSMLSDSNVDINRYGNTSNIKMYISCPTLQCVSICSNGGFESQATWKVENLQLGVLGTGAMKLGHIECTTFDLQSTDRGPISIEEVKAEDATIYSRSTADIEVRVDVNNLTVINDGKQNLHLTGKARNQYIKNPKNEGLKNEIE